VRRLKGVAIRHRAAQGDEVSEWLGRKGPGSGGGDSAASRRNQAQEVQEVRGLRGEVARGAGRLVTPRRREGVDGG
jgi:hypothetical protein